MIGICTLLPTETNGVARARGRVKVMVSVGIAVSGDTHAGSAHICRANRHKRVHYLRSKGNKGGGGKGKGKKGKGGKGYGHKGKGKGHKGGGYYNYRSPGKGAGKGLNCMIDSWYNVWGKEEIGEYYHNDWYGGYGEQNLR